MPIDFTQLSSEELFELARKKQHVEQEEKARAVAKERIAELQKKRSALVAAHEESLKKADAAIAELQAKRSKLIADHEGALTSLEKDLQELERLSSKAAPQPAAAPAAPSARVESPKQAATAKPEPAPAAESRSGKITTTDELIVHIREMILGRTYISESLIRDKLMSKGINVSGLHKLIDQLVREQRLSSKGGGNYSLGRKA